MFNKSLSFLNYFYRLNRNTTEILNDNHLHHLFHMIKLKRNNIIHVYVSRKLCNIIIIISHMYTTVFNYKCRETLGDKGFITK